MQALLDRLKKEGVKNFVDPDFPHNEKSLGRDVKVVWLRAGEFYKNFQLFSDGVCANDIRQGNLGDCYLLSSLSVLAEKRGRIEKLFCHHIPNDLGVYCVTMYCDGACTDVFLDDYFPCDVDDRTPRFSYSKGDELWVLLLEKAYAKLHGSYYIIEGGNCPRALTDLTGEPVLHFHVEDHTDDEIWNTLTQHDHLDHVMCVSAGGKEGNDWKERYGLVPAHGYGLLGVKQYKGERLLHLRNPWGMVEWNGKWSDGDTKTWTEDAKRALHYVNADDGSFWIAFEDFKKLFDSYTILATEEGWTYKSIPYTLTGRKNFLTLKTEEQTDAFISVYLKESNIGCRISVLTKEKPFLTLGGSRSVNFVSDEVNSTQRLRLPKGEFLILLNIFGSDVDKLPYKTYVSVYSSSASATLSAEVPKEATVAEFCTPLYGEKNGHCATCGSFLCDKNISLGSLKCHPFCVWCYFCGKDLSGDEPAFVTDGKLVCKDCDDGSKPAGKPAAEAFQEKVQAELKRIEEERLPKKPAVVEQHREAEQEQSKHKVEKSQIPEIRKKSEEKLEAAKKLRSGMSNYQIRRFFSTLDTTGKGSIDSSKVSDLCVMLGLPLSTVASIKKLQVKFITMALDEDNSDEIDYKEFYNWYKESNLDAYSRFLDAVEKFGVIFLSCVDGEERDITKDEMEYLHDVLVEFNMYSGSTPDFVKAIDKDDSGTVSMFEFVNFMIEIM